MSTMTKTTATALALLLALPMAGDALAKSKTKRNAERIVNVLPIPAPGRTVMRANLRIYDRFGHELGRMISIQQNGPTADPGPYQGYNN